MVLITDSVAGATASPSRMPWTTIARITCPSLRPAASLAPTTEPPAPHSIVSLGSSSEEHRPLVAVFGELLREVVVHRFPLGFGGVVVRESAGSGDVAYPFHDEASPAVEVDLEPFSAEPRCHRRHWRVHWLL